MKFPRVTAVTIFFGLVLVTLSVAVFCGDPLSFDRGCLFFNILQNQSAIAPHQRFINVALEFPALLASRYSGNLGILRAIFCACYAAVPAIALATSWAVCRSASRPSLFIWPALSICVVGLPGQFTFSPDAIGASNLLWPALLAGLTGVELTILPLVAIVTLAASTAHPIAAALLVLIAALTLISAAVASPRKPRMFACAGALTILAAARAIVPLDPYEQRRSALATLEGSFRSAVWGWPLLSIALGFGAAALAINQTRCKESNDRLLIAVVALSGLALLPWSISPHSWAWCLSYHYWLPLFTVPLMLCAALDVFRHGSQSEPAIAIRRSRVLIWIGGAFFLVLTIQSVSWLRLSQRYLAELERSHRPCVAKSSLKWARSIALSHWRTRWSRYYDGDTACCYALDIQTRKPTTIVVPDESDCAAFANDGNFRVAPWEQTQDREGWFDFSEVERRIRENSNAGSLVPRIDPTQH